MSDAAQSELEPKPRRLSRFLARQFLFSYQQNELDAFRREGVHHVLSEDQELKRELETLKRAEAYCVDLSKTKVKAEYVDHLLAQQSVWRTNLAKLSFTRWPHVLRWTAEGLLASAVVISLIVFVPWSKFADLMKWEPRVQDDGAANTRVAEIEKDLEVPQPPPAAPSPAPVSPPQAAPATVSVVNEPPSRRGTTRGMLYRMMMRVSGIKDQAQDLSRRITDMGGAKAGEVELGWRKPNGNYYHFSFPETRYDSLIKVLSEYGAVKVYKNAHERVMPEGQLRIILWIEDGPAAAKPPPKASEPVEPVEPVESGGTEEP
jgi:hypothetical protein